MNPNNRQKLNKLINTFQRCVKTCPATHTFPNIYCIAFSFPSDYPDLFLQLQSVIEQALTLTQLDYTFDKFDQISLPSCGHRGNAPEPQTQPGETALAVPSRARLRSCK